MSALIFPAMAKIQAGIHAVGVGKVRKNVEQRFNFRGIDDALNAFAPLLTDAGVFVLPAYSDLAVTARQTKSGGTTYNCTVSARFAFTATDGSQVTVGPFYAEANDTQDKAISKATSVAYRNALFLTFCVPHEPAIGGDPDGHSEAENDKAAAQDADWIAAIMDMATTDALDALKKDCIADYGMADKVPPKVKAAFRSRAKELGA